MFKNYFKAAYRNIIRHKAFSSINITGLTLGLTACLLIGLFVWDEKQYDAFLPGGEQVYRIYTEHTNTNGIQNMAATPPAFTVTLEQQYPEIEKTARVLLRPENKTFFENGKNKLYEESGLFADSTFFDIFPIAFKYGSRTNILADPTSIVLSDEMAYRLFGNEDPVGKQVLMNKVAYQVKGVFIKKPKFHLQFNYMIPLAAFTKWILAERMQSWSWHQFISYVKLKKDVNLPLLESKFQKEVLEKTRPNSDDDSWDKPFFQPLKDIHLHSSDLKFDIAQRGNITYVKGLTVIAVFILLIACFNFINLATAKSLQRAKEVGIRKTVGASKKQLIAQFTGETITLVFISIIISVGLTVLLLPLMNSFTGKHIPATLFTSPVVLSLLILLTLTTGMLAGFYPALVLSGFRPVKVLKASSGIENRSGTRPWLRNSLVVVQFTLSALLIICAIVVFKQVNYLHHKNLGFNKEQILFFPLRDDSVRNNKDVFKNELLKVPGISSVSIGYGFPGDAVAGDAITVEHNGRRVTQSVTQLAVDFDYISTLGLQVIAGRDFSKSMLTDEAHAWIINETAVKQLGFETPEKALGKMMYWHPWGAANPDSLKAGQVIGVVKDFNYKSLYDKIEPAVLQIFPNVAWKVAVKIQTTGIDNTIAKIENVWNSFTPGYPLEYKFLDDNFKQMYYSEDKLRTLLLLFTSIAIFIGCLGLFGLAAYTAERRKKEIGIRKILGATVQGVILLLSKDFIRLILVALLIASPIAWYFMNKWLQDFAYRIAIEWWMFALAGLLAILIALVTISFQSIKAAMANPVKSLRTE
ncbi:MAG: ABC transporter permease [Chitinophagaceae bacterium]|nr:ABC transporter permease [Chitinophagaceae bacterium]